MFQDVEFKRHCSTLFLNHKVVRKKLSKVPITESLNIVRGDMVDL